VIAANVGWSEAVWWSAGFAVVAFFALRRWEEHPVNHGQDWIGGSCNPLTLRLATLPRAGAAEAGDPTQFTFEAAGLWQRIGPWQIWRHDSIDAKTPLLPEVSRSERIAVFRLRFDWTLADRHRVPDGAGGSLFPGARVPLVLDGRRRGTLQWQLCQAGTWRTENGSTVLSSPGLTEIELVHHRHGLV
jgi:hypothetical protein